MGPRACGNKRKSYFCKEELKKLRDILNNMDL